MAVSCPWGHEKGHLGLLQDPTIYLACNGAQFNIPTAKPPAYPIIPTGATAPQRKELRATNAAARKAWTTYCLVLSITCNQFAAVNNDVYYTILDDPIEGPNDVDLCTLVTHILTMYAQISQPNLDDNLTEFNTGINPILPLAVYTRKQEKCHVFAHNAGVPISDATMVTTGTKHALATRNMTLVWRKWKRCPIIDHIWPNWKAHWTAAFAKMHDINCMTAGESTFSANAVEEEEQGRLIALSVDILANVSIQKMMQAWADMQIAMACMSPPVHAPPYSGTILAWGTIPRPPRPHWRHLAFPWKMPLLSAFPTGALSNQTGTRWDTVGRTASG
jgi:hypothetical protein